MRFYLFGVFLLFSVSLTAEDLTVNVYGEEFVPYNHFDDDGRVVGLSTDRVRKILDAAGLKYTIQLFPWSRAVRAAEKDPIGLLYSAVRTKERELIYDWLAEISQSNFYLYARNDDLRPFTLAGIEAGQYVASCAANDASCNMLRAIGFKDDKLVPIDGLGVSEPLMLLYGRVDLYLGDHNHQAFRLKQLQLSPNVVKPVLKLEEDYVFYLVAGLHVEQSLRDRIRTAADALRR
jgi:polar amino acid transport system substrate-binding protein